MDVAAAMWCIRVESGHRLSDGSVHSRPVLNMLVAD
jgi:hypothetical protein